jgi:hypothetical protein
MYWAANKSGDQKRDHQLERWEKRETSVDTEHDNAAVPVPEPGCRNHALDYVSHDHIYSAHEYAQRAAMEGNSAAAEVASMTVAWVSGPPAHCRGGGGG